MATDPTQRIREHLYETSIALDAHQTLVELAALPPSLDVPYVTVSLDWRFKGSDPGREPVRPPDRQNAELLVSLASPIARHVRHSTVRSPRSSKR